ncbi:hypothetical protein SmJEL517_g05632 [Synchytrium microbalum]|uniref:Anaphase-promoting complex subunit 5 n=1 Tax=Synchytrium microbalum TaxID=1806994 RepID=A0A507BMY1_9FUNG|nr:uncharacterized protein SmJEL517_g05632 [Synchytrium microbalum]TPX30917.1 hypothetical protein SmJEL517_g05632 [Synchytrium microbalum]
MLLIIEYYTSPNTTAVNGTEIVAIITRHIKEQNQGQWPEPSLHDLLVEIKDLAIITMDADGEIMTTPVSVAALLWERIQRVSSPDDIFIMFEAWKDMTKAIDENAADYEDGITIDRESPLGEFVRRACLEFSSMPFEEHSWLYSAFLEYVNVSKNSIPSFTLQKAPPPRRLTIASNTSGTHRIGTPRSKVEPEEEYNATSPPIESPTFGYDRGQDPPSPIYTRTVDRDSPSNIRTPQIPRYSTFVNRNDDDDDVVMQDQSMTVLAVSQKTRRQPIPETDEVMQVLAIHLPRSEGFVPIYNSHRYVESQIEVLRLAGAPEVPMDLQNSMDQVMAAAGRFAQADLLSFLHYMRMGEYEGASNSLHRFHDHYVGIDDPTSMGQISLLNKAALHLRFQGKDEAILDLREAVNRSREQVHTVCLSFALRWLDQLSLPVSLRTSSALTSNTALPYNLSTITDLEESRRALVGGKAPDVVFGYMTRAIALQLEHEDLDGVGLSEPQGFGIIHQVESALWESYGNSPMANLCNEVEIVQHRSTNKIEDQVIAQCRGEWDSAEKLTNQLTDINWFDKQSLAQVAFSRQLLEGAKGNPTSAYLEIASLIEKTPIAESDGGILGYLLALADIHLSSDAPLSALNVIFIALTLSQQLSAQNHHHCALVRLVDVLLYLDMPFQALQASRHVLPKALGCGDLHQEGSCRMMYGKAMVAVICTEQSQPNIVPEDDDDIDMSRKNADLTLAITQFELARKCFALMEDTAMQAKCLYLLTRTLDMAGRIAERDATASDLLALI